MQRTCRLHENPVIGRYSRGAGAVEISGRGSGYGTGVGDIAETKHDAVDSRTAVSQGQRTLG